MPQSKEVLLMLKASKEALLIVAHDVVLPFLPMILAFLPLLSPFGVMIPLKQECQDSGREA